MNIDTIIRAWKDPSFRASLSASELAELPANPAGMVEISDGELARASGGEAESKPRTWTRTWCGSCSFLSIGCCNQVG